MVETSTARGVRQIFFVRHGQSAHNIDRAALDTPDNPLTDAGREQARVANRVLHRITQDWGSFDLVVTSPMTRAIETCLIATQGLGSPLPVVLPLVTERGTSACDRGSPQEVLENRFPELNFAPLRDRVDEEWWGATDPSRGGGDAWWAEEEIRHSAGGSSPNYGRHYTLIAQRAVKLTEYLSGRPEQASCYTMTLIRNMQLQMRKPMGHLSTWRRPCG